VSIYVLNKNGETGILEPLRVTKEEYDKRCETLAQIHFAESLNPKPNKYGTKKAAQRVCDKINKTEDQHGTE